jgi:hypothetical protein
MVTRLSLFSFCESIHVASATMVPLGALGDSKVDRGKARVALETLWHARDSRKSAALRIGVVRHRFAYLESFRKLPAPSKW